MAKPDLPVRLIAAFLASLLTGTLTVAALIVTHPSAPGPVENPVLRAKDACTYPYQGATWDQNEAPSTVEYVGDSLTAQVGPVLTTLGGQRCHTIDVWATPGGAPCDFLPGYGAHTAAVAPRWVSIGFVGNATSQCMLDHIGWSRPPAHLTADQVSLIGYWYETDLRAMVRWNLANNIRTLLILPPQMNRGTWHGQMTDELIARYQRVAAAYGGVGVDDGPRDALTPGGVYRQSVSVAGVDVPVRHTDGTHLHAPYGTWLYASAALITPTTL
jgi:hypothetical protein